MGAERVTAKDCVKCGVCCVGPGTQPAFCDTTAEDEKRLGKKFVRLHVLHPRTIDTLAAVLDGQKIPHGAIRTDWREQEAGPLKGFEFRMCNALDGALLHKVKCSVYKNRPRTCQEAVQPGDRMCLKLRSVFKKAAKNQGAF